MEMVGEVAARYARGGYFTVVDGIVMPGWFFEPLRRQLIGSGVSVAYAILRPSLEVAVRRAAGRPSTRLANEKVIEQLLAGFDDLDEDLRRHVLDNSDETPEETAQVITRRLRTGKLAVE
jgi:hypothetical protein